jgi:hypothetical protein
LMPKFLILLVKLTVPASMTIEVPDLASMHYTETICV